MNKLLLAASAFLLGLSSCTKDSTSPTQSPEGKDFNISFNVALPGGGDIVYPKSRAEGDPIINRNDAKRFDLDTMSMQNQGTSLHDHSRPMRSRCEPMRVGARPMQHRCEIDAWM